MKGLGAAAASAAVIMLGGAGGAYAADLSTKAPVLKAAPADAMCTSIVDFFTTACLVQAYGVRFYGTIDIGGGYQSNGAPFNKDLPSGVTYNPGKMNNGGKWLVSPNALSQSNIGFQIKEPLGMGWSFVGQVEAAFDPASLFLANGPKSLRDQFGTALAHESGAADSSLNGQFYNSLGFLGVSSDTYGTLTFLRQRDLIIDVNNSYDPLGGAYAFGLIGGSGQFNGGGSTETIRATTSVKYRVNIANWRLGVFGQFGDYDQGNSSKGAIQGQLGADFNVGPGVFSVDAIGAYTKDAVAEGITYSNATFANGLGNPAATPSAITATISDNTAAVVGAKYTVGKLKLSAGYEWIQFAPPSDLTTSFTDVSGYTIGGVPGTAINNAAFNARDKVVQLVWAGARYSFTDSLDIAGAYYHLSQNDYSNGAANGFRVTCATVSTALGSCSGTQDTVAGLIDWKFAPKWDTYLGTSYTRLNGGVENGFLAKDNWATTGGIRFRW